MTAVEAREFDALKRRDFRPYSLGHQIMYETPLTLMTRSSRSPEKYKIIEAGFGIGWGLDRMVAAGVIGSYVGYEPDKPSFDYVAKNHGGRSEIALFNQPFEPPEKAGFDCGFCIEVIEHVPKERHQSFLVGLRLSIREGGTLWLSTPDSSRSQHGVRTAVDWRRFIGAAGFPEVTVHQDQWTTLFICQ